MSRISAVWMLLGFVSLGGASSCLYDSADRCDPGQTYDPSAGLCVCGANTIASDHGCVACGMNEVSTDGATCNCAPGYTSPSAGAPCAIVPAGLGAACEVGGVACSDATYSTCHAVDATSGYCTNAGCTTNADCSGGYACDTTTTPSYCQRPPVGAGMHCTSDADCAGTEATYCEIFMTHVCYVQGCSLTTNDCFSGNECCDLTKASGGLIKKQICVTSGSCMQ